MTLKGGSSQACAACKYQRRKCTPDCPLAPYFPPDQTKMFQNAHKLFGVRNIVKILEQVSPAQKPEAMRSINYEAYIRDRFPVHGCLGVITQLQCQIRQLEEEMAVLHAELEVWRPRQHQSHQVACLADDVASQLVLGMPPPVSNQFNVFGQSGGVSVDSKDFFWVHNVDSVQSQMAQPMQHVGQCYDEIYNIDDRQSYIEPKDCCESSLEESLKDTTQSMEHLGDNELKSAAACFSLTSVKS